MREICCKHTQKNYVMDSCASWVPYLASLWSAVQFGGFSFLHLNLFFSPVNFCWSKWNLIWGELILLLFLKCLSVPPLELSATCFIETQVMCANMLYSCTFDIFFFLLINQQSRPKMLSTVPREYLMLNMSTSKHMDFFMALETQNWLHTTFLTFQV